MSSIPRPDIPYPEGPLPPGVHPFVGSLLIYAILMKRLGVPVDRLYDTSQTI